MITKVRLKNWRSHLDSEFNFSSGTNALIGIMGSGKTSVMDAICFALFGTFPNLQSKKLKLDDIIMKKPVEQNKAEVEVFIQLNASTYSIKRIIEKEKGTTYSEIKENDKLIESPNAQRVTEAIEKILKVNYELFSKAIYSEQNALDYFLTIPKGQRMRKIDELLMIDRFEKARAGSVSLVNKIAERKIAKQSVVDQTDVRELEKIISESRITIAQMEEQKNELKQERERIVFDKKRIELEVAGLRTVKDSLELLKRDEQGLNSAIEETQNYLNSLEISLKGQSKETIEQSLKEHKENLWKTEKEFRESRKKYEELSSSLSELNAKSNFLKKDRIERLEQQFKNKLAIKQEAEHIISLTGDAQEQLKQRQSLLEKTLEDVHELTTRIKDLEDVVNQLSSVQGKCPVCDSVLTDERKNLLLEQKQLMIKKLANELEDAKEKRMLSEKELADLEKTAERLSEMMMEIKDLDSVKKELEDSIKLFEESSRLAAETSNQLDSMKKEVEILEDALRESTNEKQRMEILFLQSEDRREKMLRLEELMKRKDRIGGQIKELEGKLAGKDLTDMEDKLRTFIGREKETEAQINGLDKLVTEKQNRMNEQEQVYKIAMKDKEEIRKLDALIKNLKIFEKALEQTQMELRSEFVEAVNYAMNKLWSTLYPYQDFVGMKLNIDEGDYVLQLQERAGSFVGVDGIASGGERSIACLALRIAFSLVLAPQLKWLVLDEPTHNLDAKALEDFTNTLRERIGEFVDQVFIISHNPGIENAITGHAYRLERNKSTDSPTRVVQLG